ncbi:MAG: hypothetical protein AAGA57_05110 [Planctomycetota bacterium]
MTPRPLRYLIELFWVRWTDRPVGGGQRDVAQRLRDLGAVERDRLATSGERMPAPSPTHATHATNATGSPTAPAPAEPPAPPIVARIGWRSWSVATAAVVLIAVGAWALMGERNAGAPEVVDDTPTTTGAPPTAAPARPTLAGTASKVSLAMQRVSAGAVKLVQEQGTPSFRAVAMREPAGLVASAAPANLAATLTRGLTPHAPLEREWDLLVRDVRQAAVQAVGVSLGSAPTARPPADDDDGPPTTRKRAPGSSQPV